jgi:hypothetical protein
MGTEGSGVAAASVVVVVFGWEAPRVGVVVAGMMGSSSPRGAGS